jgi:YegS/Rv2252/BmrU family lipid kinase
MRAISEKNIAIVCNALAGAGRSVLLAKKISNLITQNGISHKVFTGNWPANFNLFTDVWIVGGDGTLNYFINRYPDIQLPLVIFKGGTGNDFHFLLYGDKPFDEQLGIALNKEPRPLDIGKCNERYFINDVGIGFEGAVAKALTGKIKRPGKTSFLITILKQIFIYRSADYTLQYDEHRVSGRKLLIDINNGRRAGGGFHVAPEARADDGLFDVVIAEPLSPLQRLRWLPVIEKGKHLRKSFIKYFRVRRIAIESVRPMQSHLDGEYYSSRRFEIEILPGRLYFRY